LGEKKEEMTEGRKAVSASTAVEHNWAPTLAQGKYLP